MTKNKALQMAIEAIYKHAQEHLGWAAKYHDDKRIQWDRWMEAIKILEELRDGK